jgi:hypothetical protein
MRTLKESLGPVSAVVMFAALSVLSDALPVSAWPETHGKPEPVTVTHGAFATVPVVVQGTPRVIIGNTTPVPVLPVTGLTGGGEDGAQFSKQSAVGEAFVLFGPELERTGKRFVVDFVSAEVGLTQNDCSLVQMRVDDPAAGEVVRSLLALHGSSSGLWGVTQQVKMYVDPGQRVLVIPFSPCDATSVTASVVGHYVDH